MTEKSNSFLNAYMDMILRLRWLVIIASFLGIATLATGIRHLELQQNYRMFFGPNNPQLAAFDALEAVYTKVDNNIYVIHNMEFGKTTA